MYFLLVKEKLSLVSTAINLLQFVITIMHLYLSLAHLLLLDLFASRQTYRANKSCRFNHYMGSLCLCYK